MSSARFRTIVDVPRARAAAVTLTFWAACLVTPATALADDVGITASADPVEDVTYQVSVSGTGSAGMLANATIKATGGQPCGVNRDADNGTSVGLTHLASGPFSFVVNQTTADSGTYLLCAWVGPESDAPPTATAQQVITIRPPNATASVAVPARVGGGSTFQLGVSVQTEVYRGIFVDVNSPGVPCAANYEANRTLISVFSGQGNTGGPFAYTANVTAPKRAPGVYGVCGYVQEDYEDTVPEATFGGQFTVVSYLCRPAQKASSKYTRLVRQLKRKLHRAHKRKVKRFYRGELRPAKRKLARAKRDIALYCR